MFLPGSPYRLHSANRHPQLRVHSWWLESELGTIRSPQRQTEPSVNKLGSRHSIWLGGLERREGRLPLSRGPRASLPALAGRGAASGVWYTPEGSPPGACLDQGLGSTHACPPWDSWSMTGAE